MNKKSILLTTGIGLGLIICFVVLKFSGTQHAMLEFRYPLEGTVYPADMAPPGFVWTSNDTSVNNFHVSLECSGESLLREYPVNGFDWRPDSALWNLICHKPAGTVFTFSAQSNPHKSGFKATVSFSLSLDPVNAPVFFRSVPLPFKFARENMKKLLWHFGDVSSSDKPHVILKNMPVCANCHSFSLDGKTIGMDVDAMNDKGSYVLTSFDEKTEFAKDSIDSWSNFQEGKFTYGLLSQISPNGRYAISTLGDCEIFVERDELEYSQLFFPFKGILVVYDRKEKKYYPLPGANDTTLVQSNPSWTPDGKYILFARAKAKHYEESGIMNGSSPKPKDRERYKKFEKNYLNRDSLIKYDIYKIPFNEGKGGTAIPVSGASENGMSNYFPRVSPDGKWLVFCQAESFMLLQRDSKLVILPMTGGKPRVLDCNSDNLNSWHSWSPNSKWLVFSSKRFGLYTQLYLTHINEDGTDTPPVFLDLFTFENFANNIPEFVNTKYSRDFLINPGFLSEDEHLIRNGEILDIEGDVDGAFALFDKAVKKFPANPDGYYKRGYMLFKKTEMSRALADLNKALLLQKKLEYFQLRGRIYLKTGNSAAATKDFNEAIAIDSTDYLAYSKLGIIYMQDKKVAAAQKMLETAVRLYNEDFFSHYNLGMIKASSRNYSDAIVCFTTALSFCSDPVLTPMIFEWRGNCQMMLGNHLEALADFIQETQLAPRQPTGFYLKGKAELNLGHKQEAINSLKQAEQMGFYRAGELLRTLGQ